MFDFSSLLGGGEAMPTVSKSPPAVDDVLLTVDELSVRWRLTVQTLANLRSKGEGPPYLKLPSGSIRYKLSDIMKAEGDGQYGFSWDGLKDALDAFDNLTTAQRTELYRHLRRTMK